MTDELQARIQRVFGPLVVNKKQALVAGLEGMPRFVVEYLIASANDKNSKLSIHAVRDQIKQHYADASRRNYLISEVMSKGTGLVIDMLSVEPRPDKNDHVARLSRLDQSNLAIDPAVYQANQQLLHGGMWGSIKLRYETYDRGGAIVVAGFKPYQLPELDLEPFKSGRSQFSFDEWVDLIVTSCGFAAGRFTTLRQKLLLLSRLLPIAQGNLNLVELGPKNTGKSYFLRNLSSRVYLSSGGRLSSASLFYNENTKRVGSIGVHKAVILDEVNATSFTDANLVAGLLDYLESGNVGKGGRVFTSDCSFLFTGNLALSPDGKWPRADYPHLFHVFPAALSNSALIDRIHGFIPGWELPRIADSLLSDEMGFLSDYFGEVVAALRMDSSFQDLVHERMSGLSAQPLGAEATIRDRKAVEKIATGLTRVLLPDKRIDDEGMTSILEVAVELRQRIHSQLSRMDPANYKRKTLVFEGRAARLPEEKKKADPDEMDVACNTTALVGTITILFAFDSAGGGDHGFVQCKLMHGRGVGITGLHGAAMEHSIHTAYQALLASGKELGLPAERLTSSRMGVHLVDIADPKDGPSAGLAFAIAMASAMTGRAVRPGLAVTGELALHGNVLEVGSVPEKLHAAERCGRRCVIVPSRNRADAEHVKGMPIEVHAVSTLAEALSIALVNQLAEN